VAGGLVGWCEQAQQGWLVQGRPGRAAAADVSMVRRARLAAGWRANGPAPLPPARRSRTQLGGDPGSIERESALLSMLVQMDGINGKLEQVGAGGRWGGGVMGAGLGGGAGQRLAGLRLPSACGALCLCLLIQLPGTDATGP
jgi:hypothetical protein